MAAGEEALVIVALRCDQRNIKRRLDTILAATDPVGAAEVIANSVEGLVAKDLDQLAAIIGWPAVQRLGRKETSMPEKHELSAVVNHFVHGSRAECKCGWKSEYVDTGNFMEDNKTAAADFINHVAEMAMPKHSGVRGGGQ